ncbi:MAG: zeta toxin family protein [Prevotellaceae bacterium]|jgi:predicted ABC-type ATPase|nr:zeta toxin family protein [Prevotellaceae bacterium]
MTKNPLLYIISGCNGAGKTTASFTILPEILDCKEFVNADEIAKGLSPFQPEKVAIEAGKIMLKRINELLKEKTNFAIETTLASKTYKNTILSAKAAGYSVTLIYFWLQNVELAKERVKMRVQEGGHNIDSEIIDRRYFAGIRNLFEIYLPIVDVAMIFDNSNVEHIYVAEKEFERNINIIDKQIFNKISEQYDFTSKK